MRVENNFEFVQNDNTEMTSVSSNNENDVKNFVDNTVPTIVYSNDETDVNNLVDTPAYFATDEQYSYVLPSSGNIANILEEAPDETTLVIKKTYQKSALKMQQLFRFYDANVSNTTGQLIGYDIADGYNRVKRPKKHKKKSYKLWDLIDTDDIGLTSEEYLTPPSGK